MKKVPWQRFIAASMPPEATSTKRAWWPWTPTARCSMPGGRSATLRWIVEHAESEAIVFIDAPQSVANTAGQRLCEKHVGQRCGRWRVSANSTNLASKRLGGLALCTALVADHGFRYDDGLDGPPTAGRAVSECYPYTTIAGYESFGYEQRAPYNGVQKVCVAWNFGQSGLLPATV